MDSLKGLIIDKNKYNKSVDKWEYVCYNDIRNKENLWSGSNKIRIEATGVPQK